MVLYLLGICLGADAISFTGTPAVKHGEGHPSLSFHAGRAGRLTAQVSCSEKVFHLDTHVGAGGERRLELAVPKGAHPCEGSLTLLTDDGDRFEHSWTMEVASLDPIRWSWSKADLNLAGHSLVTHPSRPLERASVELFGAHGVVLDQRQAELSDPSQPRFQWSTNDEVVKLVVTGFDRFGFHSSLRLVPWRYDIPHEEVVFASGSHTLAADQRPQLDGTWADVVDTVDKYGSVVDIKLYVVGHTDTVGNPSANQALSERRARSIASWYRQRGFDREIWYLGLGERGLAVPTPDETDEQRNRRAQYILAAEPPPLSGVDAGGWRRL